MLDAAALAHRAPDHAVLWAGGDADTLASTLAQLAGVVKRHLVLLPEGRHPAAVLWSMAKQAGLRRSPVLARSDDARCLVLEPHAPGGASFDPLFDAPAQAPRLLGRYAFAAALVRPCDRVLVLGCQAGAGAALLAATTRSASVAAHEADAALVAEAARQYGERYGIRFASRAVAAVPPGAIDLLVAVDDAAPTVDEVVRMLRPDGRGVIVAQPVQDWSPDALAARADLIVEQVVDPRERGWPATAGGEDGSDPLLFVVSRHPLRAGAQPYAHPEFEGSIGDAPLLDFAAHYQAPWIYRPLVQMGERLRDDDALVRLALDVLEAAPDGSADVGAALCVLAYQILKRRQAGHVADVLNLIDAYLESASGENPHARRWCVSLGYAAALACLLDNRRSEAALRFERVLALDAMAFSPLLCTKQVAAAFWLGVLGLSTDVDAARAWFLTGTRVAARALAQPIAGAVGNTECPAAFGFAELAEVADMAAQCANALQALPLLDRAPGLFWQRVQTRRFGLSTWLQQLDRENAELREALARAQSSA
ncbi:MAG: hypothetical protein ACTHKZ_04135 [Lysobacteraceae bacterium]